MVSVKATRAGQKKPFYKAKSGEEFHHDAREWHTVDRGIDTERDLYVERIIRSNGEVVRDVRESLRTHRGHGSARINKTPPTE